MSQPKYTFEEAIDLLKNHPAFCVLQIRDDRMLHLHVDDWFNPSTKQIMETMNKGSKE